MIPACPRPRRRPTPFPHDETLDHTTLYIGSGTSPTLKNVKSQEPTKAGINVPQGEFDDYGHEMGPEARVWRAYAKEANKYDNEQAENWNKSLDVTLIFAALFSAICTAFVIEASKMLKEDPMESSAKTLALISQTLIGIASNNSQPIHIPSTALANSPTFSPSALSICVNALWFFALTISMAVSLIAMLAKEWSNLFVFGRHGMKWSHAKRRHMLWNGIKVWKMQEFIMYLPSLMQLAYFSFTAGLCIYLWGLHFGVALPVMAVTLTSAIGYIIATALPLRNEICPYSTTVTRLLKSLLHQLIQRKHTDNTPEDSQISFQALLWLLETCEDPQSTNIALQALGGANKVLSQGRPSPYGASTSKQYFQDALMTCRADRMIYKRLATIDPSVENYEYQYDLYIRALYFLDIFGVDSDHVKWQLGDSFDLTRRKILDNHIKTHIKTVHDLNYLYSNDIDKQALVMGQKSASRCLQTLQFNETSDLLEHLESAIQMLDRYGRRQISLRPVPLYKLVVGAALSLSCLPVHHDPAEAGKQVLRLIPGQVQIKNRHLALLLTAFALTNSDCLDWAKGFFSPLSPLDRVERAIEAVAHYSPDIEELSVGAAMTMINFGLLELLFNPKFYALDPTDFKNINDAFLPLPNALTRHVIHTLSPDFDIRRYAMETITRNISLDESHDLISKDAPVAKGYLVVLDCTYNSTIGAPTELVYVFVVECLCQFADSFTIDTALNLMHKFPVPDLSEALISTLNSRKIVQLLITTRRSENENQKFVACGLLALLAKLTYRSAKQAPDGWDELASHLLEGEAPSSDASEERMKECWGELVQEYKEMLDEDQMQRDKYMKKLLLQIQN